MTSGVRRGRAVPRPIAADQGARAGDRRGRPTARLSAEDLHDTAARLATLMQAHPSLADGLAPLFEAAEAAAIEARAKVDSRARASALAWTVNSP